MSTFTGISGIAIGDGNGGYVSLSIQERVNRILATTRNAATYLSARAPQSLNAGSAGRVYYRKPQVVQTNAYTVGQTSNDLPQVGQEYVDINTQRTANYQIETFDAKRIADWGAVEGEIARSLAYSIMLDHDSAFLTGLKNYFEDNKATTSLFLVAPKLVANDATVDEILEIVRKIAFLKGDIEKTYNKYYEGVPGSEVIGIFDVYAENNFNYAIARGVLSLDAGVKIMLDGSARGEEATMKVQSVWGIKFIIDNLMNINVAAGNAWSKDQAHEMSNYIGFLIHQEFAAMPLSLNEVVMVRDTNNANPKWIAKFGYGFGVIRPGLGRAIVKVQPE